MYLEALLGGGTAEKVLLYIATYGEGHAQAIARTFGLQHATVRYQLLKFEEAGILVALQKGRTRLFVWNPRWPFRSETQALLDRALELMPQEEREKYFVERRRPRRTGKVL